MQIFHNRSMQLMHSHIPEGAQGVAKIKHVTLERPTPRMLIHPGEYVRPGKYTHLYVHGALMMSDTTHERVTNMSFVQAAQGDVLVGGLGIGFSLLPVLLAPEVRTVTVVEKYQDVLDLVAPHLRGAAGDAGEKLRIECVDLMEFKPARNARWDVVYFDIWPNACTDNLRQMTVLHRRFGRRKRLWMDSWMHRELMRRKRAGR